MTKLIKKLNFINVLKPEIIAVSLILIFGIVFIFLIKPLQVPDESHQFLRAYELSDGQLFSSKNTKKGCVLGGGQISHQKKQFQNFLPTSVVSFITQNRNNYNEHILLNSNLNPSKLTSVCSTQTELNSPIGYVPQVIAILILRIINAPPIIMDYFARLFILIAWTIIIYFAIKIIPVRKWTITAIALLPIAIQQSISISPDALTTSLTALLAAYIIRSYYQNREKHFTKDLIIITILSSLATLSKPVAIATIVLIPFYFLNTVNKTQRKKIILLKIVAMLIPLISYLMWSFLMASHNISINETFILSYQKSQFFKSSQFNEFKLFLRDAKNYLLYGVYFSQFGSFEWFSKSFPHVFDYLGIAGLTIILLVSYESKKTLNIIKDKQTHLLNFGIFVSATGVFVATLFSLFIIWTPINSMLIEGIQFRYFLPILMILATINNTKFLKSSSKWYRNFIITYVLIFFIISALTLSGVIKTVS